VQAVAIIATAINVKLFILFLRFFTGHSRKKLTYYIKYFVTNGEPKPHDIEDGEYICAIISIHKINLQGQN